MARPAARAKSTKGRDNRVRPMRRALELTQAELAEQVGVTRQTIVALEAGDYAPSVYLALALAQALGTTVEDLFGAHDRHPTGEPAGEPVGEGVSP